ncbi:MAG: hypothetical protein IIB37_12675 [Gemmatimonadetes bacterium]|nr:hypothetical protein [Gemmatimonadota bacterium]MCH8813276.1 hypothetical protein [Gemmatimonadota bacterium]
MADEIAGDPGPEDADEPVEEGTRDGNASSPVTQLMAAPEEIWTMSEMEAATPCNIIEVDEDAMAAELDALAPMVDEAGSQTVEGGEPDDDEDATEPEPTATSGGYNYPPPFTRYEVLGSYKTYPYRTMGKLFFKMGGTSFVCSAASIGGDAIWTAGHCVHAGNGKSSGWATNVVFVPAYKDGAAPYGQWQAKQLIVRTAWYKNGNPKGLCQDMGGAILHRKNGKKISQRVGWLGFAYGGNQFRHWDQFGYPAAAPFNGKRLITSQSSFAYFGSVGCSPNPVGVGSDLTGGSSGGPWILKFGTGNYLHGNNSYRRKTKLKEMFSPRFNKNAKSLFDALRK